MIGYLVTYRNISLGDNGYCKQKFFKDYHSFIYWMNVYMLDKNAHFHGDIYVISDPEEYEKTKRSFEG